MKLVTFSQKQILVSLLVIESWNLSDDKIPIVYERYVKNYDTVMKK